MNVAAMMRTAHAFGASFVFSIGQVRAGHQWGRVDTSAATGSLPYYGFDDAEALLLPKGCELVGIEITDDAIPLDRKSVVSGKRVSVRVDLVGGRIIKKQKNDTTISTVN